MEFKLFASLTDYLPPEARRQSIQVEMPNGSTVHDLMDRFRVPRKQAHLVICNGLFLPPSQRETYHLQNNDVIALWPPVAGG